MVNKVRAIFRKEISDLHEAAYVLAFFSIISQIFALFRDRLLANEFGTSLELDIYYASFKLPDLIFVIVSSLVSISVLVPMFVKSLEDHQKIKKITNSIFTVLSILSFLILSISFFMVPKFLSLVVPNLLNSDYGNELILITKILLIQPIILSFSSLIGGLVQSYKKFTVYAVSPILYNLGIILGIVFLYPKYGLVGLAYGVIIGATLHLFFQIPFIFEKNIYPKFTFDIKIKEIWFIVSNSFPRTASMFANQGILIFMTFLASSMIYGSISVFNLSYNLSAIPLAIIGVSYSLAVFPSLSKYFQNNEIDKFYESLNKVLKHIIFWALPVMAMFIVLRAQIVRVILGSGNFDWESTRLVAASLAIFTVSIFAQSISLLFLRAYYSMEKTLRPFLVTLVSFLSIIFSSKYFIKLLNSDSVIFIKEILRLQNIDDISVLALAISFSLGQVIYMILLVVFLGNLRKIINLDMLKTVWQSLSGSLIAFLISFFSLNILDNFFNLSTFWGIFMQGFFAGILGLVCAFVFFIVIRNREIKIVMKTIKHKFWKTKPLAPEVEEEL